MGVTRGDRHVDRVVDCRGPLLLWAPASEAVGDSVLPSGWENSQV